MDERTSRELWELPANVREGLLAAAPGCSGWEICNGGTLWGQIEDATKMGATLSSSMFVPSNPVDVLSYAAGLVWAGKDFVEIALRQNTDGIWSACVQRHYEAYFGEGASQHTACARALEEVLSLEEEGDPA